MSLKVINQSDHIAIVKLARLKEWKLQAHSDFPFTRNEIADSEKSLGGATPFLISTKLRSAGQLSDEVNQPRWEVTSAVGRITSGDSWQRWSQ